MSKKMVFLLFIILSAVAIIFINFFGTLPDPSLSQIASIDFLTYDEIIDDLEEGGEIGTKVLWLKDRYTEDDYSYFVVIEYEIGPSNPEENKYPLHDLAIRYSREEIDIPSDDFKLSQYVNQGGFQIVITFPKSTIVDFTKVKFELTLYDKKQTQVTGHLIIQYKEYEEPITGVE